MFENPGCPVIFAQLYFLMQNTGRPVISKGLVKMFETPERPVIFSEQLWRCTGVKVFVVS